MENKVQLKNIKSYLSGKNPIKETPKGFRYKFFNKKRKFKDKTFKSGDVCFFSDYGDKACYNSFKYSLNVGKFEKVQNRETTIWFRIKNNRLVINKGVGPQNRTISNNPGHLIHSFYPNVINRLKPFLISWLRKNNFKIKKKWLKYGFNQFILVLCYPEIEYLFDVGLKFDNIPGFLAKDLRGAKGYNHILDRVFGFHGKKLKECIKNHKLVRACFCGGKTIKDFVSDDDILSIIPNSVSVVGNIKESRYFLRNYKRDTIVNWFKGNDGYTLSDTITQYYDNHKNNPNNKIILPDSNNLEEIHNVVTANYRRLKEIEDSKPIDYGNLLKKYDSLNVLKIGSLEIRVPQASQEIIEWSSKLSNCMSGYIKWHGFKGVILGIFENNEIKYGVSINSSKILEQFYKKYNGLPDKEDYILIVNKLKELKFVGDSLMDSHVLLGPIGNLGGEF